MDAEKRFCHNWQVTELYYFEIFPFFFLVILAQHLKILRAKRCHCLTVPQPVRTIHHHNHPRNSLQQNLINLATDISLLALLYILGPISRYQNQLLCPLKSFTQNEANHFPLHSVFLLLFWIVYLVLKCCFWYILQRLIEMSNVLYIFLLGPVETEPSSPKVIFCIATSLLFQKLPNGIIWLCIWYVKVWCSSVICHLRIFKSYQMPWSTKQCHHVVMFNRMFMVFQQQTHCSTITFQGALSNIYVILVAKLPKVGYVSLFTCPYVTR